MMTTKKIRLRLWAVPAAATLVLAGCAGVAGGDDEKAADGEPIMVAALASLSYFPEAPPAAQAVFDDYNAAGGFNGRPIDFQVFDDRADPAVAATAARDALSSGAVALVGSSSALDCAVNNKTWVENNIISIQGTGSDPFCFATPNIAPVNTGPFFGTYASLWNGSEVLGFKRICAVVGADGGGVGTAAFEQARDLWEAETGNSIALWDDSLVRGQPGYAGNVAQINTGTCDSIFINAVGPEVSQFLAEATNQGIDLPVLALSPVYSQEFADTLVYSGDVHVPAEFSPWSDPDDASNDEWRTLMESRGIGLTAFAQGGYLAAKAFIHLLENEVGDGEVTREAVTNAATSMTEGAPTGGMTGEAWVFGPGTSHQPNAATWPLVLKADSGQWTSLGPWFLGAENGWVNTIVPNA